MWVQDVPGGGVRALAFAPDSRTLYAADNAGAVTAWDTASHARRSAFKFSPPEREPVFRLQVAGGGAYLLAGMPHQLLALDAATGAEVGRRPTAFKQHFVALPGPEPGAVLAEPESANLNVWWPDGREEVRALAVLPGRVWSFDLAPDGHTGAALCAPNPDLVLFDPRPGGAYRALALPQERRVGTHRVQFVLGGRAVAVFHMSGIQLWDVSAGAPVGPLLPLGGRNWNGTVAFHPTARAFAAVSGSGHPALFDLDTGQQLRAFDFALGTWATCLAFAPDGLTCAVGGSDKQFAVFDVDL